MDYLSTEKSYPLDITSWGEKGEKLRKAIEDAFKDTQRVIVRSYPDTLVMTKKQYDELKPKFVTWEDMGLPDMGQEFFLWKTKDGYVMQIEVKDA